MKKADREFIKQGAKQVPTQELTEYIMQGIAMFSFAMMKGDKKRLSRYGKELYLLEKELKNRGFKVERHQTQMGAGVSIMPYTKTDPLRNSPIKMTIPTITELLAMPLPKDLPKHGYVSIQLPEKM